jgi:hypothetical protein
MYEASMAEAVDAEPQPCWSGATAQPDSCRDGDADGCQKSNHKGIGAAGGQVEQPQRRHDQGRAERAEHQALAAN